MDPLGARRDGGKHDVTGGHGEVVRVVLANAEEVDLDLFGQDALLQHVADRLSVRLRLAVDRVGTVPERIEPEYSGNADSSAPAASSSWPGRSCQALRP